MAGLLIPQNIYIYILCISRIIGIFVHNSIIFFVLFTLLISLCMLHSKPIVDVLGCLMGYYWQTVKYVSQYADICVCTPSLPSSGRLLN